MAKIEEGSTANTLKYGFFCRHRRGVPEKMEVLRLIETEMAKSEPGESRRWFLLASVSAFAQARVPGLGNAEDQYLAICEHAERLKEYPDVMKTTLFDLVAVACPKGKGRMEMDGRKVEEMLLAVLPAWLCLGESFCPEPDLGRLSHEYGLDAGAVPKMVQQVLQGNGGRLCTVRRAGAYYEGIGDFEKAVELLAEAEALPEFDRASQEVRRDTYGRLVGLHSRAGRKRQATDLQEKAVRTCGGSRVTLATLYHDLQDATNRDRVISEACVDFEQREDAAPLGALLGRIGRKKEATVFLEKFIGVYTQSDRYRLAAVVELATLYRTVGDQESAARLFAAERDGHYPENATCSSYLAELGRLRDEFSRNPQRTGIR